jgi:hypothetical protein
MDICQRVEESPRRGCSDPADLAVNAHDYSCRAADATKERLDAARSTSLRAGLLAATTLSLGRAISYNTRVASQSVFPFALRFLNAGRFGTILAVQPLIAFLSQRQKWLR